MSGDPAPHLAAFASYAHEDVRLAQQLHGLLEVRLQNHRRLASAEIWWDEALVVGERWRAEIGQRIEIADVAFLFLSTSFFGSPFIREVELPALLDHPTALVVPVGLEAYDMDAVDMRGVEERQIFRFRRPQWREPRSYDQLGRMVDRNAFADALVRDVVATMLGPEDPRDG